MIIKSDYRIDEALSTQNLFPLRHSRAAPKMKCLGFNLTVELSISASQDDKSTRVRNNWFKNDELFQ